MSRTDLDEITGPGRLPEVSHSRDDQHKQAHTKAPPATLIVAMPASASGHDNIAGLATTEKNNVAQPRLTPRKEKNNVVRTISPPLALVATTEHVPVSRNGDEPQEEHLADWLSLQRSRRGTIVHKTVKKRCRDNQSRGRPRIDPSALAPARNPQDLVHPPWGVPIPVEKRLLNRAAVVTVTPLGSRITVFPRGSGPRTLCMCVYLVCMELIRGAQPRSDCQMLCVYLLVSRSTDGDGRDILSRAASCSSCFLHRSSRCL